MRWIDKDSRMNYFGLESGAGLTRHDLVTSLTGENASVSLSGLTALSGKDQTFHHLTVHHLAPHGQSNQTFKSILSDEAVSEYDSLVHADHAAFQTVSHQLNKNLLLSENARAYSRPQLKIDTDDVQCQHGATMGQLDPDEVHYLQSRGIDEKTARRMIILGFADDVLKNIPVKAVADRAKTMMYKQLEQVLS